MEPHGWVVGSNLGLFLQREGVAPERWRWLGGTSGVKQSVDDA